MYSTDLQLLAVAEEEMSPFTELVLSALGGFALVSTWTNVVVHHNGSVIYLCYIKG